MKLHRERNWLPIPFDVASLDAVVLSHAHRDHSGFLPVLVKRGCRGPVYASTATRDPADVLLCDSAHLPEEDARRTNKFGLSKHGKALPLYTGADAARAVQRIARLAAGRGVKVGGVEVSLTPVGHLLGANAVTLATGGERVVFSGDLGRQQNLLLPPPECIARADVLLIEATYGNRLHPKEDVQALLGEIVRRTVKRGGSVLLPSFAVGRAQALLLVLQRLKRAGDVPPSPPQIAACTEARNRFADRRRAFHRKRGAIDAPGALALPGRHHLFVVHGEPEATDALRFRIGNELGWRASVPPHAQTLEA